MNFPHPWRTVRPLVAGLVLLLLRFLENTTGFDDATGLSLHQLPGKLLAVGVVALLVLEYVLALRLPKTRRSAETHFAPPQKSLPLAVAGCMLLAAGGVLLAIPAISVRGGLANLATGALGLLAGLGLLAALRKLRAGGAPSVAPLLPALFFGVFLVLTVYLPPPAIRCWPGTTCPCWPPPWWPTPWPSWRASSARRAAPGASPPLPTVPPPSPWPPCPTARCPRSCCSWAAPWC